MDLARPPRPSKQAWTWIKKRLAFCEVTQDGGQGGCFRLPRLPTAAKAEEIRDIIGIRKRIELSPEVLARRQELGHRWKGNLTGRIAAVGALIGLTGPAGP